MRLHRLGLAALAAIVLSCTRPTPETAVEAKRHICSAKTNIALDSGCYALVLGLSLRCNAGDSGACAATDDALKGCELLIHSQEKLCDGS